MTAADVPVTTGNPDQGNEGLQFVGYTLYDSLVNWDLSRNDLPSDIRPGLAASWEPDSNNYKRWIFHLRRGVRWHDGCGFTADDVIWNFGRLMAKDSPQFSLQQFAYTLGYLVTVADVKKIDDYTVAVDTKIVDSLLPYSLSYVMMVSRCRAKELHYDWNAYAVHPSGTGPYRFSRLVPHERLELVPNRQYWDTHRVPKHDRLVLVPMPEAAMRTAALLSGQVNFIEDPVPDHTPRLRKAGMQVLSNIYPHVWWYLLNVKNGPFRDIRVRRAANHAINRADVKALLRGFAQEAYATVPPVMPYYGHPVQYRYDPDKARSLLRQAGCLPCKITIVTSPSGSGLMQPLRMNELIKFQLEEVGFVVNLDVMDWASQDHVYQAGGEQLPEIDALNAPHGLMDPENAIIRIIGTAFKAPHGLNWGHFSDPNVDANIERIYAEFDAQRRNVLLTRLHELISANALMLWVVHGMNTRALAPTLHGFIQAQSWFQDLTPITVTE